MLDLFIDRARIVREVPVTSLVLAVPVLRVASSRARGIFCLHMLELVDVARNGNAPRLHLAALLARALLLARLCGAGFLHRCPFAPLVSRCRDCHGLDLRLVRFFVPKDRQVVHAARFGAGGNLGRDGQDCYRVYALRMARIVLARPRGRTGLKVLRPRVDRIAPVVTQRIAALHPLRLRHKVRIRKLSRVGDHARIRTSCRSGRYASLYGLGLFRIADILFVLLVELSRARSLGRAGAVVGRPGVGNHTPLVAQRRRARRYVALGFELGAHRENRQVVGLSLLRARGGHGHGRHHDGGLRLGMRAVVLARVRRGARRVIVRPRILGRAPLVTKGRNDYAARSRLGRAFRIGEALPARLVALLARPVRNVAVLGTRGGMRLMLHKPVDVYLSPLRDGRDGLGFASRRCDHKGLARFIHLVGRLVAEPRHAPAHEDLTHRRRRDARQGVAQASRLVIRLVRCRSVIPLELDAILHVAAGALVVCELVRLIVSRTLAEPAVRTRTAHRVIPGIRGILLRAGELARMIAGLDLHVIIFPGLRAVLQQPIAVVRQQRARRAAGTRRDLGHIVERLVTFVMVVVARSNCRLAAAATKGLDGSAERLEVGPATTLTSADGRRILASDSRDVTALHRQLAAVVT